MVLNAQNTSSPQLDSALETLYRAYWYPLYAYVRKRGYDPTTSQDLTQEFFAQLLRKQLLAGVDPTKGRFRSWLLGVMNHLLAHEGARGTDQKLGGDRPPFSLDEFAAEQRYGLEPVETSNPERIFERRWASNFP